MHYTYQFAEVMIASRQQQCRHAEQQPGCGQPPARVSGQVQPVVGRAHGPVSAAPPASSCTVPSPTSSSAETPGFRSSSKRC